MRFCLVEMFLGLPHVCFLHKVGRVVVHKLLLLGLVFFGLAKLGAYHHVDEVGVSHVCVLYGVG